IGKSVVVGLEPKVVDMRDLPNAKMKLLSGDGSHIYSISKNSPVAPHSVFTGAKFQIILDSSGTINNGDYIFDTSSNWMSISSDGVATIGSYLMWKPQLVTVAVITATPKPGVAGFKYKLSYKPKVWFHTEFGVKNHPGSFVTCVANQNPLPYYSDIYGGAGNSNGYPLIPEWGMVSAKDGFIHDLLWNRLITPAPTYSSLKTGVVQNTSNLNFTAHAVCLTVFK
ncbi:hypothetical protein NP681_004490, partial [Salmonella enterica]|nr:hypothetical protein [Salmonella enterica]